MRKLIILDRDGVINQDSKNFVKSPAEWHPIPGSLEAIAELNEAGYSVAIATNQSGIARGLFDIHTLDDIHQTLQDKLSSLGGHIDAIFVCPHGPDNTCDCRKPKPGLMYQAFNYFQINPTESAIFAIGDSLRDLEAAKAAGCTPILVLTGNGEKTKEDLPLNLANTLIYENLRAAVDDLIKEDKT